jgi:hypothetical protein
MRLSLPAFLLSILMALALSPSATRGQEEECQTGRISYIFIDNQSIFDLSELDPEARFRWAYELANRLHIRTREEFIRDEILFHVGECLDPFLLEESERLLRGYRFIGDADVFPIPQPDGTQHVNVYTRDEWTTKVDLGLRFDDGLRIEGVELTEENFWGRGILLRGFLKTEKEVQDLGMEAETPRIFNSRWDARISLGSTRTGNFFEQSFTHPFVGEVGRFGARENLLWRETVFSYSTEGQPNHTNLILPFLDQRWDVAVGGRLGRPGRLTVLGIGVSRESVEFRDFPGAVEYVVDKDFSNPIPVDSVGIEEIQGQVRSRRANRINFFLGQRNIGFVQRRGLDALNGIQDVPVGAEIFLGLGKALGFFREGGGLSTDDVHAQASLFAGAAWEQGVLNAQIAVEGRSEADRRDGTADGWRDVFGEADLYLYWHPWGHRFQTFLFRISTAGGWSTETPFQLTLGGRTGLRGYPEEAMPGAKRIVVTLEDRIYLPSPSPGFADIGVSAFVDIGRMWPGEAPFGVDSGWVGTVGAGLRLGLPPGTENVIRLDLAMPVEKKAQLKDLIFRVNLSELLGILPGLRDHQLLRSLRSGVRPTFITTPW